MDLFNVLGLVGGLSLFLFGMSLMGTGLEKSAGNKLKILLERLTTKKLNGFLMGLAVTSIIQNSSATTVMVVGFVNSGIMTLKQAIHVIMGANVGTTITAWILSLAGIQGSNLFIQLLKPSSFTPILALIGIIFYMFVKNQKKKDIGLILLGFATLIYGMEAMSAAVEPLGQVEGFRNLFLTFSHPVVGVLVGTIVTGIIQSSSASVGILQALSATGQITMGAAIHIIMGQNIGTTVTALISSVGTNKNARRAALVHLYFNVIGTVIFLSLFVLADKLFSFAFVHNAANHFTIAIAHSTFNILCTSILLPFSNVLEKLAYKTILDDDRQDKISLLDARLFSTPAIAIYRSKDIAKEMAYTSMNALKQAMSLVNNYDEKKALKVRESEQQTDTYEDALGTYLVKLSGHGLNSGDSIEVAKILFLIGEFERIADYALDITLSAQEIHEKKLEFSSSAKKELDTIMSAVEEIVEMAVKSFTEDDLKLVSMVDPLEEVIDDLKSNIKKNHIGRLQCKECTIEHGFVFSDLLTVLERVSDHCSNIAGAVIELSHDSMNMHDYLREVKYERNQEFKEYYMNYSKKYALNYD